MKGIHIGCQRSQPSANVRPRNRRQPTQLSQLAPIDERRWRGARKLGKVGVGLGAFVNFSWVNSTGYSLSSANLTPAWAKPFSRDLGYPERRTKYLRTMRKAPGSIQPTAAPLLALCAKLRRGPNDETRKSKPADANESVACNRFPIRGSRNATGASFKP